MRPQAWSAATRSATAHCVRAARFAMNVAALCPCPLPSTAPLAFAFVTLALLTEPLVNGGCGDDCLFGSSAGGGCRCPGGAAVVGRGHAG